MRCIHLHPLDNIAIVTGDVTPGEAVTVDDQPLTAVDAIPRFNKIALTPIAAGERVLRYGLPIGLATTDIAAGQFVHLHNIKSAWIPTFTREHDAQQAGQA